MEYPIDHPDLPYGEVEYQLGAGAEGAVYAMTDGQQRWARKVGLFTERHLEFLRRTGWPIRVAWYNDEIAAVDMPLWENYMTLKRFKQEARARGGWARSGLGPLRARIAVRAQQRLMELGPNTDINDLGNDENVLVLMADNAVHDVRLIDGRVGGNGAVPVRAFVTEPQWGIPQAQWRAALEANQLA